MQILLVDDDRQSRDLLEAFLGDTGHSVSVASNAEQALLSLRELPFNLMLADYRMPGMNGLELLEASRPWLEGPLFDVVLITAFADIDIAVAAIKGGAFDYLRKPLRLAELAIVIEKVQLHQQMKQDLYELGSHFDEKVAAAVDSTIQQLNAWKQAHFDIAGLGTMSVFSPLMHSVIEQAARLHSNRMLPVLLEGETGTGKELVAKYIHYGPMNQAEAKPFVALNCANLNQNLLESELFGYEAGAFTGGVARGQIGKVDMAEGGTLFLDELDSLPGDSQAKILRLLEDKSYYRVGGHINRKADIRIIAASNRNLQHLIDQGNFRSDLFYRLAVARLYVPSLRDRPDDIIPLATLFINEARGQRDERPVLNPEAGKALLAYHWPGNVRELRNLMHYAAMMNPEGTITGEDLGPLFGSRAELAGRTSRERSARESGLNEYDFELPPDCFEFEAFIDRHNKEVMRKIISRALQIHGGNKSRTAEYLRLSRRALYRRLEELGLE